MFEVGFRPEAELDAHGQEGFVESCGVLFESGIIDRTIAERRSDHMPGDLDHIGAHRDPPLRLISPRGHALVEDRMTIHWNQRAAIITEAGAPLEEGGRNRQYGERPCDAVIEMKHVVRSMYICCRAPRNRR